MKVDYTGVKINRLTVKKYVNRGKWTNGRNKWMWECECECGGTTFLRTNEITLGKRKSCGCYMKDFNKENNTLPNNEGPKRELLRSYKASAKKRNKTFELSNEVFFKYLEQDCHYCGAKPANTNNGGHIKGFKYNGVDRVDNTVGYTEANCVPCCHKCNDSKKNYTKGDWFQWLQQLYNFQKSKGTFND